MSNHEQRPGHIDGGDGTPGESWLDCSCTAHIWHCIWGMTGNTDSPEALWAEHLESVAAPTGGSQVTAPSQPVREQMLMVLNPAGWAQVERLRAGGTPDEEAMQVVGHNIETLTRLLDALSALSDAAVEAGAKALYDASGPHGGWSDPADPPMDWEHETDECRETYRRRYRAAHAAMISSVQGGRA